MSRPPFLFGNNPTGATQSKYLVEFKAGKMTMKGKTVHPVKKKGTVYLHQSDDSLMHFCWKDRTSGQTEDDLILFPDDAEFKRVAACTTGRVYVLKFKSSNKRSFFWMQEPKEDKDDDFCSKINEYLNNPPPPGSRGGGAGSGSGGLGALGNIGNLAELGSEADLQSLFNNMSQQQLMQMLGGVVGLPNAGNLAGLLGSGGSGGSGTGSSGGRTRNSGATNSGTASAVAVTSPSRQAPATTTSGSVAASATVTGGGTGASPIQLQDLQSIISGLSVPEQQRDNVNVDLSTSINYEALQPLLANEAFMTRVKEHLPPGVDAAGNQVSVSSGEVPEQLAATVSSPQFQQALSIFSGALQSGQLGPLIQQFGLGGACVSAANDGNLDAFVKALEASEQAKKSSVGSPSKKEDDNMALD